MNYYPTFFITSASLSDGKVVLSVQGSPTIENRGAIRLIFAPGVAVPSDAPETAQVAVSASGKQLPLYDKFSQKATLSEFPRANGLFRTRFPIACGLWASSPAYAIAWNLPIPTEYVIPL